MTAAGIAQLQVDPQRTQTGSHTNAIELDDSGSLLSLKLNEVGLVRQNGLAILLRGGVTVGIQLVKDVLAVRAPSASPGEPNAKASFDLRALDGEVEALLVLPPCVGSAT